MGQVVVALAAVSLINNVAFTLVLAIAGQQSVGSVLADLRPVLCRAGSSAGASTR